MFSQRAYLVEWVWQLFYLGFLVPNVSKIKIKNLVLKNLYEIFAKPILTKHPFGLNIQVRAPLDLEGLLPTFCMPRNSFEVR